MATEATPGHGSVKPTPVFEAKADAAALNKAMDGTETDDSTIIDILTTRSNSQRQDIKRKYKEIHGKDLEDDFKAHLRDRMQQLALAMMESRPVFDAQWLNAAMKGQRADETVLLEIMFTRTNQEISDIIAAYKSVFGEDLESDLIKSTREHLKDLLVVKCQTALEDTSTGGYERAIKETKSSLADLEKAKEEAIELLDTGAKNLATFNRILGAENYVQLRATFDEFEKVAHQNITKFIESKMPEDMKQSYKIVVQCVYNRAEFFADRLYNGLAEGTIHHGTLIRLVVSRSESDLDDIKRHFKAKHQKPLYKVVEELTTGGYRKMLLELIGIST